MTQAVCFKCGEMKHGAFTDCPHCGGRPVTDDELVLSLAMTDHYFDLATMKQMGARAPIVHLYGPCGAIYSVFPR